MRACQSQVVDPAIFLRPGHVANHRDVGLVPRLALSQRRNLTTVAIPTIYIDNNRSSKFRPVTDSVRILYALLGWELHHSHRFKP